ncbi:MAG: class I SAM-dependent methyltransferase [Planctomycetes bacterium]|nr:class I SAM-dependent methyltransferase [Planctomycetota bacterium]
MSNKTPWEEFFDSHAPVYNDNCFTQNTAEEIKFILAELDLKAGNTVLDVGCGTGRHAVALAKLGIKVTGIDLSSGMLAQAKAAAKAAGVELELIHADATKFNLERQFDCAICLCEGAFGLLSSTDDAIAQPLAILKNISESLKPGAKCLLTVLSAFKMIRQYSQEDVEKKVFDPLTISEVSSAIPADGKEGVTVKERGFVPTELILLFKMAGLEVLHLWGGTAGSWKKAAINLDEYEIMIVASKPAK